MTMKPKSRKAAARASAVPDDPIFALIAEHKAAEKEWLRLGEKLDIAGHEAAAPGAMGKQYKAADRAWHRAGARLSRTKPTTPAGAGALIAYIQRDFHESIESLANWHMPALKTVAAALARMGERGA